MRLADRCLPRRNPGAEKDWWNTSLSALKRQSIEIHQLWIEQGRPGSGPTHLERMRVRADYRRAIKAAQMAPKIETWDKIHTAMEVNDTHQFWSSWRQLYSKNKSPYAPMVDGKSTKEEIAEVFKNCFQSNSIPNNQSKVDDLKARFDAQFCDYAQSHMMACDCDKYEITIENVVDAISRMKEGKCADESGLHAEHFHHAPFSVVKKLTSLFNQMMRHSCVPRQFRFGLMLPIIKDYQGNHGDSSNYRGITISPIVSKIFEHVLKIVFSEHLTTSSYQYGFKKGSSTIHALYCLKQTIEYYVNNGSKVYCSFLDASKAFDRLVHAGLFIKLMKRKIPLNFLAILITWHNGLWCRVRWDDHVSDWFPIMAGVRQGGVLSPDLYGIYVDDLILILIASGVGCHYIRTFAAALFYADDMAVLAPSLKGLQKLLDLCSLYCNEWDIRLNSKKTKNLFFGCKSAPSHSVTLDNDFIPWESKWKYLGITLKSGVAFGCCTQETVAKYYRALNALLRVEGRSNDMVMLRLIEAHCISILTYGIEILHVRDRDERRKMRVAYNAAYRKLFCYSLRESVTDLQHCLHRPTWEELTEKRQRKFCLRLSDSPVDSLARISLG